MTYMYVFLATAFVHFYLHMQKLEVSDMGGKFLSENKHSSAYGKKKFFLCCKDVFLKSTLILKN